MASKRELFARRCARVRASLRKNGGDYPRLSVFRSSQHIYAQVIDDVKGVTLVAASTMEKSLFEGLKSGSNVEAAKKIGQTIAERAVNKGVSQVKFDRGGYKFHGRVKALADAAREAGLKF